MEKKLLRKYVATMGIATFEQMAASVVAAELCKMEERLTEIAYSGGLKQVNASSAIDEACNNMLKRTWPEK